MIFLTIVAALAILGITIAIIVSILIRAFNSRGRRVQTRSRVQFSKLVLALILIPYFYAAYIGGKAVLTDTNLLYIYLGFIAAPTSIALAFYSWKAKAENVIKIKNANPEIAQSIDITNLNSTSGQN